jgi:hypothetical protein
MMFASWKTTGLATHRLPVCRVRNVALCALQRRSSGRARQRAFFSTDIEIESSQKQTTGEAIVAVDGFAIGVAPTSREAWISGCSKALNGFEFA